MYAMQYQITLPTDYDMQIIRDRVIRTGHLMDGYHGLEFKAYLIQEKTKGAPRTPMRLSMSGATSPACANSAGVNPDTQPSCATSAVTQFRTGLFTSSSPALQVTLPPAA